MPAGVGRSPAVVAPGEGAALPWPVAAPKGYTVPPESTIQYPAAGWFWLGPVVVVIVVPPVDGVVPSVVVAPGVPWHVSVPESSTVPVGLPSAPRNCQS